MKTIVNEDINRHVNGYMVNTVPSLANRQKVADFQAKLADQFGKSLWLTPSGTLHITLMDWIAPLVDYGEAKDKLFKKYFAEYDEALTDLTAHEKPITVHFDMVKATPGAIILTGEDDGSFQRIRDGFLGKAALLPGTKQPPTIIHSSLARYTAEQDLGPIAEFVANNNIVSFDHTVTHFRLVQEHIAPQLNYTLIKEYSLGG
ncbi:MAG TPA: hypothetical protein VJ836_01860 [Candidatus Saccharimonadales bacterium]|nr:hypothetical protein [Candidatus Saccharimonadales bacterium]